MPIYPYSCSSCCKYEEIYLKLAQYDTAAKPRCCGEEMQRVYTPPMVISDDLGIQGVVNPADGKKYDSKSAYYKSVKDAGCHIVGADAGKKPPKAYDGDHNVRKELKEAIHKHLGG